MIKYILWLIAAILIVNVIVSLICGHLSTYYNDSIRSTYSGFDASVLGILMIIMDRAKIMQIKKPNHAVISKNVDIVAMLVA